MVGGGNAGRGLEVSLEKLHSHVGHGQPGLGVEEGSGLPCDLDYRSHQV